MSTTMINDIVMFSDRSRCYEHILAVRGISRWRRFIHTRKLIQLTDNEKWKKAVEYHRQRICKRAFDALKLEVRVSDIVQRRRHNLCFKYAKFWKMKTDMHVTSITLEQDFILRRMWKKWRVEFIKIRSANQVTHLLQQQSLHQVFTAWHGLCQVKSRVMSQHNLGLQNYRTVSSLILSTSSLSSRLNVNQSPSSSSLSPTLSTANLSFGFNTVRRVE